MNQVVSVTLLLALITTGGIFLFTPYPVTDSNPGLHLTALPIFLISSLIYYPWVALVLRDMESGGDR